MIMRAKVALEAVKGNKTVNEIAQEYGVHPTQVGLWKKALLENAGQQAVRGWMKGFPHEVLFVRRVFTNKDGSIGLLNQVCSDFMCDGKQVATIYQKRWEVEKFHKSLKSNAGLAKPLKSTKNNMSPHNLT